MFKEPADVMLLMVPNVHTLAEELTIDDRVDLDKYRRYALGLPENFDCFVVRMYAVDDLYCFLWSLRFESLKGSDFSWVNHYKKGIQSGFFSKSALREVVKQLQYEFPKFVE